jgi:ribose transport system substrate-binding protein
MIEMRKRATHLTALGLLGSAALFAGCNSPSSTESGTETAQKTATQGTQGSPPVTVSGGEKAKIAVIPKGLTHSFWQAIKRGAEKAGGEMNAEIIWTGPASESDGVKQQQQIVEDQITKKVDGIVIAPINKTALVPVIDKAAKAGIPVVIADSDAQTKNRISYVATDNYVGGQMAAERIWKLTGGKGPIGMVPVQANSESTEQREKGFADKITELSKGKVKVIRSVFGESDRKKSMTAAQDMLTANPNMLAIFGPNESSAVGAMNAVRSRQQLGKIKIVGFDTPPILVEAVKKGDVDSIVVQNPFKMGYEGVKAIVDKKANKAVEARIDTGVKLLSTQDINKPENKEWLQG